MSGSFSMDFYFDNYRNIIDAIVESEYDVFTVKDYLKKRNSKLQCIILRHDVDGRPERALMMAKMEKDYGIKSTYYFRTLPKIFNLRVIKEICEIGHEVGYHYEVLDEAKGDIQNAINIFEDNLVKFNKVSKIETICMHGNPFSKWDNRDLWKLNDFMKYGILGEAYLSMDFENLVYITDSSRSWKNDYKIKDIYKNTNLLEVMNSGNLSTIIKQNKYKKIYLLIHPDHWSNNSYEAVLDAGYYFAVNMAKVLYKRLLIH
jgi:hypothetical protein